MFSSSWKLKPSFLQSITAERRLEVSISSETWTVPHSYKVHEAWSLTVTGKTVPLSTNGSCHPRPAWNIARADIKVKTIQLLATLAKTHWPLWITQQRKALSVSLNSLTQRFPPLFLLGNVSHYLAEQPYVVVRAWKRFTANRWLRFDWAELKPERQ